MDAKKLKLMKSMAKVKAGKKCKDGQAPHLKDGKEGIKSSDYKCVKIDPKKSIAAKKAAKKSAGKRKLALKKALKTKMQNDKLRKSISVS